MATVQLTGKQSDFLKIVVAAAGRGDLEAVQHLLDVPNRRGFTPSVHTAEPCYGKPHIVGSCLSLNF